MVNFLTKERVQYNGMLLLASYVQRLHVYYATLTHLEKKQYPQLEKAKVAFESLNAIMPMFEETKQLTQTQYNKLVEVATDVTKWMDSYFQVLHKDSFSYRVAIVASTLFSEQLMNNGVIRLGMLFKEQISPDFERRVQFYEDRTKMIQFVVLCLKDGKEIEQPIIQIVEDLFTAISKQEKVILDDIQKIIPMLGGKML